MDARSRQHERRAAQGDPTAAVALLRERQRAGLLRPECPPGEGGRVFRLVPLDPEAALRVRAFVGCEASRALLGNGPHEWLRGVAGDGLGRLGVDLALLHDWLTGLHRLAGALPAIQGERECEKCDGGTSSYGFYGGWFGEEVWTMRTRECTTCNVTGRVTETTPYADWLLVACGVAVGREVLPEWDYPDGVGAGTLLKIRASMQRASQALDAADAWLACPCTEHRRAWALAWDSLGSEQAWAPAYTSIWNIAPPQATMGSAALQPGWDEGRVRRVVRRAVLAKLGGEV